MLNTLNKLMAYSSQLVQGWASILACLTFEVTKAFGKPIHRSSIWAKALSIWQCQNSFTPIQNWRGGFMGYALMLTELSSRIKVTVSIFGRPTPVELEFTQVAKTA